MTTDQQWQPTASLSDLRARAEMIQSIRHFFIESGYLEVETPCMGDYGVTDCYLQNIEAKGQFGTLYMQTSPEYFMKRLLAAGSGPIFQIGKAYRDEEFGRWHQPEFTLLEFYQLDINHIDLIHILDELLTQVCAWPAINMLTYQQLFEQYCQINPHKTTVAELKDRVKHFQLQSILPAQEDDIDQYLFLLMAEVVEPNLASSNAPIAIIDFPKSQCALARIEKDRAERFELYYRGVELANGFHELRDVSEQKRRFAHDNRLRRHHQKKEKLIDPKFLAALAAGLPPCSGVAVGIDRLIALLLGCQKIESVIAFART